MQKSKLQIKIQDWPIKRLGEIVVLNYGKGIPRHDRKSDGKYPVYGANGILDHSDKYLIDGEAIIVGRKGSAGEVARVFGKFWPSDVTYFVLGNKQIDIDYLFHLFKSLNLQRFAVGVKPGINRNRIYELEILLPPLSEQKKIVAKLERVLVKISEAKKLRIVAQETTDNLLPAELHKIFTTPHKQHPYKLENVGISSANKNGWQEKEINDICEHPQYGFTASSTRERVGPKFLRITDIQEGRVSWGAVPYCKCSNTDKYKLAKGDIVFARTGATVGKSYLVSEVPKETIYASYLIRLRVKSGIIPEFLYYFFQSPEYWEQITNEQVGMAQPNVNGSKLAKIKIPLPSLAEQKKIVARLDSLSGKIGKIKNLQSTTQNDFTALEQSILSKAFSAK